MKIRITAWVICLSLLITCAACSSKERDETQPSSSPKVEQPNQKKWEQVSRGYRVQGKITGVVVQDDKLKSIALQATKNRRMENNPVDYDFVGKTLDVQFENAALDLKFLNKLKKGTEIIMAFAQYALPDGKVVDGTLPEWIYFETNGAYEDLQGKSVNEKELRP
ncbi:MAG: hypothetical protein WD469_06135 [Paenibacillaceae bacterium]